MLYFRSSPLVIVRRDTYKPPKMKSMVTLTFLLVDMFSFQIIGIGIISRMKSVMTFEIALP